MARPSSRATEWLQYLALRGFAGFAHSFSVERNLEVAAATGSLLYRISRRHRERAIENLSLSFPDWPREHVERIAERSMQHTMQMFMVDAMVMPRLLTPDAWPRHVYVRHLQPALDLLVRGHSAIFLTGHCGNWELLGYTMAVIGYPLHAIARPLDNRLINDWLQNVREASGMRLITKFGAAPILQDVLRHGGSLGFIADQNAGDDGMFVPFFGRLASTYKSIGLLAMRFHLPIVAGVAHRLHDRFEFDLSCTDCILPEQWAGQPDPLFYITARYNRAMENMIRAAPEQYLWLHRRWRSRPRHEREGKPMPHRLIAKLEALPWMTQAELDLIVNRSNEAARATAAAA